MAGDGSGEPGGGDTERSLSVEFEIDPTGSCPIAKAVDVREVHHQIGNGTCRADVLVDEDDRAHVAHLATPVDATCSCPVFDAFDCVPRVRNVDGALRVSTFVADRETLTALVAALRDTGARVRLRRISETPTVGRDGGGNGEAVPVSLDALTETQRDTLRRAVVAGYYATPRGATLDDLADEFGVSKSAVSRRLSAAESKLVGELFPCPG